MAISKRRRGFPRLLKFGLTNFTKNKIPLKAKVLHKVRKMWAAIVGNKIALHSEPHDIKNNKLIIYVDDPIWINELNLLKDNILEKIHNRLTSQSEQYLIYSVRFSNGEVPDRTPKEIRKVIKKLDPLTTDDIENTIANIEDKNLKEALRTYFTKSILREKNREMIKGDDDGSL